MLGPSVGRAQTVAAVVQPAPVTTLVTINAENMALPAVLQLIAQQAGLVPMYDETVIPAQRLVTVHLRQVSVADAFSEALRGTRLAAQVRENGNVLIVQTGSALATGGITGTVTDAATKRALSGVTITVDDAKKGVVSGRDGVYRLTTVAAGRHVLRVRLLGYTRTTLSVTVVDGETAMADIVMRSSVNTLDQVVVTGTVVPTELKAVPNAITVITAKELEQRGITHIDQLFRGDVPGLWAQNQGSGGVQPGKVIMLSRGNTKVDGNDGAVLFKNTPIKTYVDGVELADPSYLGLIDPRSIERIEIIPGPQASTIYGANAVNGVMQIFTKRGSPRPQLTFNLESGLIQNSLRPAMTPQHDYSGQVSGTQGGISYSTGGSWTYLGPWTPAVHQATTSGFAGLRVEQGRLTLDGSLRRTQGTNWQNGDTDARKANGTEEGLNNVNLIGYRYQQQQTYRSQGQTLALEVSLTPWSWWTQTVRVGSDALESTLMKSPQFNNDPSDSLPVFTQGLTTRTSVAYTTTVQGALTSVLRGVLTVGADGWHSLSSNMNVSALTETGCCLSSFLSRIPSHDRGGFVQAQLGMFDQVFVTYGVRAEWNPEYGANVNPNLTPRYGIAVTRELGQLTTKVRASYGTATQTPARGQMQGISQCSDGGPTYCQNFILRGYDHDFFWILPNVNLLPSHQRGGEGGVDLYYGSRGSLSLTYFNQTVNNIIEQARGVDSVLSLIPARDLFGGGYDPYNCYPCGYWSTQHQYVNAADIRNSGMSVQGTWNVGAFTTTGTYSWTKSRVIGITPRYRQFFPILVPGAAFMNTPEHTFAGSVQYARRGTSVALNLQGQGILNGDVDPKGYRECRALTRLWQTCGGINPGPTQMSLPGYLLADLNVTHHLSAHADGVLQIQNLANSYAADGGVAVIGRQTKAGLRIRL